MPFGEELENQIKRLFTHFAKADEEDETYTREQLREFAFFIEQLKAAGVCPEEIHAANSAGILNYAESYFTMRE